eukprot:8042214-Alexandrium_andersonii.AAC.1
MADGDVASLLSFSFTEHEQTLAAVAEAAPTPDALEGSAGIASAEAKAKASAGASGGRGSWKGRPEAPE